jgi:dihydroxy-acid dehydratase
VVGHVCPEAFEGGPIALVENGDIIVIDAVNDKIDLQVTTEELAARKAKWVPSDYKVKSGLLYKYAKQVSSASLGCVTDL